jgi:hypothetical protein
MRTLIAIFSLLLAGVFYQEANPPDRSAKTRDTSEQGKKEVKRLTVEPPPTDSDSLCAEIGEKNKDNAQASRNNSDQRFVHLMTYLNATSTVTVAVFTILIWRVYRAMLRASKINERALIVTVVGIIETTPAPPSISNKSCSPK